MADEPQQPPDAGGKIEEMPCAGYLCPHCERAFFVQLPDLWMLSVCPFCQKAVMLPSLPGGAPSAKVM